MNGVQFKLLKAAAIFNNDQDAKCRVLISRNLHYYSSHDISMYIYTFSNVGFLSLSRQ